MQHNTLVLSKIFLDAGNQKFISSFPSSSNTSISFDHFDHNKQQNK
jgi:hypothetical protein